MSLVEEKYFELLKKDISQKLRETYPGVDDDLSQWKGDDIIKFQNDLIKKASGRISEKWFYTHIKNSNGRMPRIDLLNLLCKYVGFDDWSGYKGANRIAGISEKGQRGSNKWKVAAISTALAIALGFAVFSILSKTNSYTFYFVNALTREPLGSDAIEIVILKKSESPICLTPDKSGRITFKDRDDVVRFIVKGAYYQTDTITRIYFKNRVSETIPVKVNDFALMLHMFSKNAIGDWKKRRARIDSMFADDAQIFQVLEGSMIGMEMYNKEEFINKLTMPLSSLNNIEVIETAFEGKKIKELRFKQK